MLKKVWRKIQDAVPDTIVGILKRHLEPLYDRIARTPAGRKFAQALKDTGPVGRKVSEAFLNLLGALAADVIPRTSSLGAVVQDLGKDFTPEMLSRFLDGMQEVKTTASTPTEQSFAQSVLLLQKIDQNAALELVAWVTEVPQDHQRHLIAAIGRLDAADVASLMKFTREQRQAILEVHDLDERLAERHSVGESVIEALGATWEAGKKTTLALTGRLIAGLALYGRWLVRFMMLSCVAMVIWISAFAFSPTHLSTPAAILFGVASIPLLLWSWPLLVLSARLYKSSSDVRESVGFYREVVATWAIVCATSALFMPVSPRLTLVLFAFGFVAFTNKWKKGETVWDAIASWAAPATRTILIILLVGRVLVIVGSAVPATAEVTNELRDRTNDAIADLPAVLWARDDRPMTEREVLAQPRKFNRKGETLFRCVEVRFTNDIDDHYRCYQRRRAGHDPDYNREDIALNGVMVEEMEHRQKQRMIQEQARAEAEAVEASKRARERQEAEAERKHQQELARARERVIPTSIPQPKIKDTPASMRDTSMTRTQGSRIVNMTNYPSRVRDGSSDPEPYPIKQGEQAFVTPATTNEGYVAEVWAGGTWKSAQIVDRGNHFEVHESTSTPEQEYPWWRSRGEQRDYYAEHAWNVPNGQQGERRQEMEVTRNTNPSTNQYGKRRQGVPGKRQRPETEERDP